MTARAAIVGLFGLIVMSAAALEVVLSRITVDVAEPRFRGDSPVAPRPAVAGEPLAAALPAPETWRQTLGAMHRAAAAGDVSTAVYEWHVAFSEALDTQECKPMIEVGDAALELGRTTGITRGYDRNARQAYMVALVRARRLGSDEAMLRVALAFDNLGDTKMAAETRALALRLARGASASR